MIPILFAPDEKDFTTNGLGRLTDCRVFEVTEERNGVYEAYFEYPVEGAMYSLLQYGYFVFATHDESKTPQAFEIYSKETSLDGWAKYRAWHISYALNDVILRPFTANSCSDAMSKIAANSMTGCPFTFTTDKSVSGDFVLDIPKAARAVLGGTSGSILDVYGKGDYEFDMFNVKLWVNRGADRGVSIRYGKNLTKLDQTLEGGNIINGVVPYWQSTDGEVVALDKVLYGNAIAYDTPLQTQTLEVLQTHVPEDIYAQYANLKIRTLDLSSEFENAPTLAELQAKAEQLLTSSDDYEIQDNIKVDFVALWQTEEYKNYAALERVFLCDTVHIFYEKLGVNAKAKCIKVVYDTLRERYASMELGEPQTTFGQQVTNTVTESVVGEVRGLIKGLPDKSYMQNAIDYATKMIQGGLGGYVVIEPDASGHPEEILIMDTPDKATAVNVWRFNQGGLGHSSTGYNGPYSDIALTADGKINANLITTGTLDASVVNVENINADNIVAGTISDNLTPPKNYWNLDTGTFVTKQGTIGAFTINGSGIIGSDGATVYPWKVQVANINPITNDREITGLDEQKVYFQKYPNNGSTLVYCGNIMSMLSSAGYGILNLAVGFGNTTGVTLYDPTDPNHTYVCQLGSTQVIGDLTVDGNINFNGNGSVRLLTGVQGSNTINGAYTKYSGYIVVGTPGSSGYATCYIPKPAITTSNTTWLLSDQTYYINFKISYSGNNIIFGNTSSNNGTKTVDIYGIV